MEKIYVFLFLLAINYSCRINSNSYTDRAKDKIILTVGNEKISKEEFIFFYQKNYSNKSDAYTEESLKEYLDLFINFKLKLVEALNLGLYNNQTFKNELAEYEKYLLESYWDDESILDELAQKIYKRLQEEIKAMHILIKLNPNALPEDTLKTFKQINQIRQKAIAGEDFGKLALEYSNDPSVKFNKGDLGYFTALGMVVPFEEEAYLTPVGQISSPIRTKFGYHIIKVKDRRPSQGKVKVAHILVRNNENDSLAQDKIQRAFQAIQQGQEWNNVCNEYSEDNLSKSKNGELPSFGVGEIISDFAEKAFMLKDSGDISPPFRTSYGWHIIKLIQKYPLQSFKEMEENLKKKIKSIYKEKEIHQLSMQKLKDQYDVKEFLMLFDSIYSLIDSTVLDSNWKEKFSPHLLDETFLQIGEEKNNVADFVSFLRKKKRKQLLSKTSKHDLNNLYQDYLNEKLTAYKQLQLEKNNPTYRYLLKEYKEGTLVFNLMEKQIWEKNNDSIALNTYFQANKQRYRWGKRAKAIVFQTVSDSLKTLFLNQISSKNTGEDIAKSYFVDLEENFKQIDSTAKIDIGFFEKGNNIWVDSAGEQVGRYFFTDKNHHYIVVVDDYTEGDLKNFLEASSDVLSDFQQSLEEQWIDNLKKKYTVSVNRQVFNSIRK